MTKFKIKKGDLVQVIAGDDKGKQAKVLHVFPKTSQVLVEGCKIARKTVKISDKNPNGGFVDKEMPINISNVKKVEA